MAAGVVWGGVGFLWLPKEKLGGGRGEVVSPVLYESRAETGKGRKKRWVKGMEEEEKKERWKGQNEGHGDEMENVIGLAEEENGKER
ncbi:hypothetical protein E2C01_020488 [Portunus trituberculatus]|uniref:Uncharacterized protein n=1 Tax=Portunus trituberculatus TaxID=210409 RepID=A0A5B7E091_PORTR|nr:hypothetical protein [Portunus trituberculatus]